MYRFKKKLIKKVLIALDYDPTAQKVAEAGFSMAKAIKILVMLGDTAESILKTLKDLHSDIIVMGSHSRRQVDEILMGSVTEQVLLNSSVPLFIIPTRLKKLK